MNITSVDGNWVKGSVIVRSVKFAFSAKIFSKPNKHFGITNFEGDGHISKLDVTNVRREEIVARYDRGWDINLIPTTGKEIVSKIESEKVISAVSQNL